MWMRCAEFHGGLHCAWSVRENYQLKAIQFTNFNELIVVLQVLIGSPARLVLFLCIAGRGEDWDETKSVVVPCQS